MPRPTHSGREGKSELCVIIVNVIVFLFLNPMAFRAVELSLGRAPRERAQERIVEHVVLPHREEVAEVMQFAPLERGPDPVAKQMTDIPMPPDMVEIVAVVQEVARLVPQEEVQRIDEE